MANSNFEKHFFISDGKFQLFQSFSAGINHQDFQSVALAKELAKLAVLHKLLDAALRPGRTVASVV